MSRNPITILVTEPEYFTPESLRRMQKIGTVIAKRMSRNELMQAVKNVHALVVRVETKVDKELLRHAKNIQCVVSATTGLNHIDTRALQARTIPLFSLHGTHSIPTAEHALALLLSAARNIPFAHTQMKEASWERWKYIGTGLNSKTLGIFGIGRIGTEVAKRARGLQMKVIAYDPYVTESEAVKRGAKKVTWATFLKKSDFISFHAPLTKETRHIFSKREFNSVKPSLILINTARGLIVDEKRLVDALRKGRIRAAAIDVYSEEPLPLSSPLRQYAKKHRNLILTPHIGASTHEAISNASIFAVNALVDFFETKRSHRG